MKSSSHFQQGKIKISLPVTITIIASIAGIILIILDIGFYGTGFDPYTRVLLTRTISDTLSRTEESLPGKTLWDWMQLLIIPAVLAIGAFLFSQVQKNNEMKIAGDNQREAALQAYIDKMSELLLEGKLRGSDTDNEARTMARVRTLTVLPRLDKLRKRSVIVSSNSFTSLIS
ncbi:MAG TPA: hypothetical protein VNG51_00630 [Ktedonobacteraceae bacterium]|nr:hypothetical protein [Ktedonobacteraceae bacterium]